MKLVGDDLIYPNREHMIDMGKLIARLMYKSAEELSEFNHWLKSNELGL